MCGAEWESGSSSRTVLSVLRTQIDVTTSTCGVEGVVMRLRTTAMRQVVQAGTISMSAMSLGLSGSGWVFCEYSTSEPRLGGVSEC